MAFSVVDLNFGGVKLIKSDVYHDERGFFRETFKLKDFVNLGLPVHFPQENMSFSNRNVIRGIHYQVSPFIQTKLISCLSGKIVDIAVNLIHNSDNFLNYVEVTLDQDGSMLYIPEGFGHIFIALEPSIISYKATNLYSPEHERCIRYDDPDIGIHFEKHGITDFIVSEKDKSAPLNKYAEVF